VSNGTEVRTRCVPRRDHLSVREFRNRYLVPAVPVILGDAMQNCERLTRWTPEFFAERFGGRVIFVSGNLHQNFFKITVKAYIAHCHAIQEALQPALAPMLLYAHSLLLSKTFPELLEEFKIPSYFLPNWLRRWPVNHLLDDWFCTAERSATVLFIGPPGAGLGVLHQDRYMTHSWISGVYGHKRVWLASPDQSQFLYPKPGNPHQSLVRNMASPDLVRFPKFAQAEIYLADIFPGDTLLIPAGWWHFAECMTISISLSANFVNDTNFSKFKTDVMSRKLLRHGKMGAVAESCVLRAHELLCRVRDVPHQVLVH
jgi:histone arginine demethylase JMJD6